jgi:hypothetical protein
MDVSMEELNNRQMVLLTMFTSFVVSIATGIITVAMLEEAPPTITQTVNRVVEHTIERVVTGTTTEKIVQVPVVTTPKEPSYQSEDELVALAIDKNQRRLVEIWQKDAATSTTAFTVGVLVSRDGVIAVDRARFLAETPETASYHVRINDEFFVAEHLSQTAAAIVSPVTFLKIVGVPEGASFDPVSFLNRAPRLGQTIIMLGNAATLGVWKSSVGKITPSTLEGAGTSTPKTYGRIDPSADLPEASSGTLVLNLDGQAVGIVVSDPDDQDASFIIPMSFIAELLNSLPAPRAS